jgi:hypothetical protein
MAHCLSARGLNAAHRGGNCSSSAAQQQLVPRAQRFLGTQRPSLADVPLRSSKLGDVSLFGSSTGSLLGPSSSSSTSTSAQAPKLALEDVELKTEVGGEEPSAAPAWGGRAIDARLMGPPAAGQRGLHQAAGLPQGGGVAAG